MTMLKQHYVRIIFLVLGVLLLLFESFVIHDKDLDIFVGASRLVAEGKTCYEVWLESGTSGLKYFYSPLFAVLMIPFGYLPQWGYNLLWISASLLLMWRSFMLLQFYLPLDRLSQRQRNWFWVLVIISVARMIADNLALGQMTILLIWGTLESMRLIFLKRYPAGCALLALIINIKLIPLGLLAYLVYKRELKAAGLIVFFLVLYLYLPALVVGFDFNNQLLLDWKNSLSATQEKSIYEDIGRSSLSALVPSLMLETPLQFSIRRNIIIADEHTANLILNATRLILLTVLAILMRPPFKIRSSRRALLYDLSLVCLATPLIFPHQGKYALYYTLPAYSYCIFWLMDNKGLDVSKKQYRSVLAFTLLSFALITLTTDGLIGRKASDLTEYLHLPVYGMIFLIVAVGWLKRDAAMQIAASTELAGGYN